MKTAKGGVGKKGEAPVKKGTVKKKVTKKPVGNAMTKKAPGSPVAGAAKKKPVGVKRQSARMKNTTNANSEKKTETSDDVAICEATDEVMVIESTGDVTAGKNTDEVVVCETPDLTTVEAKNVSEKTLVKEAARETTLGKVHTDTASSDLKEPSDSPSQVATSSGSKGTLDVLSKIENKNSFGNKKEEKILPVTGEKKISGNLGALMANFFSRHREKEKSSTSDSEEKVPAVTAGKENSSNNQGDEAKKEADQQEKSDGGKTSEKPSGKSDDNSVENQERDKAKTPGESNSSGSGDTTSFEKGKNDAEKDCKSEKNELSPEKANVKRPATRKGITTPKTSGKVEEDKQEENECRKVTSSIGALLAGLGSRPEQMPEIKSSPLPKGKNQNPKVDKFPVDENKSDELKVDEPEKVKAKLPKARGSPRAENKDQEKDNVESKKIQSLGSLLAGLGSRKEEFMSPDRQTSSGKNQNPKVDKFPVDENKSDELKVDEPEKVKAKLPKTRGSPRAENKDQEKDNVESKKIQSLGSILAGLGSRKEEFMSPDRQTSSGKNQNPKVDKFPVDENKSDELKVDEPEKVKAKPPKTRGSPRAENKDQEKDNVESKKIQSLGSILAGLGSRKEEFMSPDRQTSSGKNQNPKVDKFPVDENKSDELKVDEPEKVKAKLPKTRGSPRAENKDQEKDNVESKKIQSLGSILAGLGSRKEEFMSPDRQTSSGNSEIPKVDKFSPGENKSDTSKVDKFPDDENKISDVLKFDEPGKQKAKLPKPRGTPRVEDKDQESISVESKKIQSLGSLLAGLGSRKEEFMSPDRQTSSGKMEIPKVDKFSADKNKSDMSEVDKFAADENKSDMPQGDKFPADENKSDGFKVEPEKEKAKLPKSRGTPRVEDEDQKKEYVESKKIQSLGSLLAGLGSRKEEFKSPDTRTSSGKIDTSEVKQFSGDDNKSSSSKLNEPDEKKKIQSLGSVLAGLGKRKEEFKNNDVQTTSDEKKKMQSLGSVLAGLGNRKEEFKNNDVQTTSGQSNVPRMNQFPANESKWGGSKTDEPEKRKGSGPNSKGVSKVEDKSYVEKKKIQSLGSLLAGLGSRKEEFMSSDGYPSSDSRGGSRMSDSNRKFGDFGFVSDKLQRNKKRSWDSSEDNNYENQNFGKSKRMEEPVVKEENDVVFVRGHVPKPKPTEKELANRNKSLERNMTFEQEAERRKTHCLGNLLSSLANRPQSFPDNPPSRSYSDQQSSRGYSDRTSSRGYPDRTSSRGFPDRTSSRGYSDHPRNYSDRSTSRSYDRPPSGGYSDRSSSRSYQDHPSSSNNSYGQDRQWNRGREETDFRKRRRDDGEDSDDDGQDRRWREKDDNKRVPREKKEKEPFDPKKAAEIVKSEEERIEKEYGPGIFSVGFTENRILAFVCEICSVQLTKATLEVHADGMQHLKKKNLWEKKKRIQKAGSEEKVTYAGGRSGWVKVEESEKSASATPSPAPSASAGDGSFGFDGSYGQGGYGYNSQFFKQPPPFGSGRMDMRSGDGFGGPYGVAPVNNPALAIPGHINTAIPPPPPPSAEAPPKPKTAKGGATVSLLQRLDACAVKSDKDLDLAASVISALLKSLKEFNHKRGDTKVIEVLTEIDIKFRSLKPKSTASTYEKPASDSTASAAAGVKPTSSQSGYSYSEPSSAPNYDNLPKDNSSGTWYSQGRGNSSGKSTAAFEAIGSSYSNKSSGSYTTASKYSSQPPPANVPSVSSTGYSQQTAKYTQGTDATSASYYSSSYSAQTDNSMKQTDSKKYMPEKSKDTVGGYYTQPPVISQPGYQGYPDKTGTANVMEIIRSGNEPPPPPPPESNNAHNYGAQGYSSYPPMGYYNLSAPPPNFNPQQY
ncbi:microtubule-associated protein futsch-like isoform X3 [Palaemon carinicauda]|uniref:microtubule-associated protein futsch-like isoform X3 n=1 Tax=Palaemon carinicauda TaxID=392227 RepID=UPI0035B66F0B